MNDLITRIANDEPVTAQELFSCAVAFIAKQGRPSVNAFENGDSPPVCAYRGAKGLKCAVGCLIPDSKYSPDWEGLAFNPAVLRPGANSAQSGDAVFASAVPSLWAHQDVLRDLQMAHDDCADMTAKFVKYFLKNAAEVADMHGLEMPELETPTP